MAMMCLLDACRRQKDGPVFFFLSLAQALATLATRVPTPCVRFTRFDGGTCGTRQLFTSLVCFGEGSTMSLHWVDRTVCDPMTACRLGATVGRTKEVFYYRAGGKQQLHAKLHLEVSDMAFGWERK